MVLVRGRAEREQPGLGAPNISGDLVCNGSIKGHERTPAPRKPGGEGSRRRPEGRGEAGQARGRRGALPAARVQDSSKKPPSVPHGTDQFRDCSPGRSHDLERKLACPMCYRQTSSRQAELSRYHSRRQVERQQQQRTPRRERRPHSRLLAPSRCTPPKAPLQITIWQCPPNAPLPPRKPASEREAERIMEAATDPTKPPARRAKARRQSLPASTRKAHANHVSHANV